MAMNNVYYRFAHLVSDGEYAKMPANLRMNVISNPGIDKVDLELMSLAVSAVNGCAMCMDAHVVEVVKGGVTRQSVQTAIRIGAVLSAAAQVLEIEASARTFLSKSDIEKRVCEARFFVPDQARIAQIPLAIITMPMMALNIFAASGLCNFVRIQRAKAA